MTCQHISEKLCPETKDPIETDVLRTTQKIDGQRPSYSIIIPAYNEGMRVSATLERVLAYVAERGWDAEIIAVNDGSRDNTAEIIRGFAESTCPAATTWRIRATGARDTACATACCTPRAKYLLFSDADLSSPIEEAEKLFAATRRRRGCRHWLTLAAKRSADATTAASIGSSSGALST